MKLVSNNTGREVYLHTQNINLHNAKIIVAELRKQGVHAYTEPLGTAHECLEGLKNVNVLVRGVLVV